MPSRIFLFLSLLAALFGGPARAELSVDITKGVRGDIPLAIVPFAQNGLPGGNLGGIVAADLGRSGRFSLLPEDRMPERPAPPEPVNFPLWQSAGQENVVIGRVEPVAAGRYEAEYFLFDAIRGTVLTSGRIASEARDARHTAHRIADIIFRQLTGERGVFDTRVAYVKVSQSGGHREFRLEVADADGEAPEIVLSSPEPLMSPAWSPDGKRLAYVSFEDGKPAIFVQTLSTGERRKVSSARGINGAPAFSPDGSRLALTLSKDGSPDIYVLELGSGSLSRLTQDSSIETEPDWSPDGRAVVFTSDRGGSPQLYLAPLDGGPAERLTFDGEYNARGVFSPDGRRLAMVHGSGGGFRIAVMDLGSRELRVVSEGPLDESPGFSPDGSKVLYTHKSQGIDRLEAVSVDGKTRYVLNIRGGDVRAPAWSP